MKYVGLINLELVIPYPEFGSGSNPQIGVIIDDIDRQWAFRKMLDRLNILDVKTILGITDYNQYFNYGINILRDVITMTRENNQDLVYSGSTHFRMFNNKGEQFQGTMKYSATLVHVTHGTVPL